VGKINCGFLSFLSPCLEAVVRSSLQQISEIKVVHVDGLKGVATGGAGKGVTQRIEALVQRLLAMRTR
jgi:hypothetical protein